MLNILNSENVNAMAYTNYTWEKKSLEIKVKKYNHRLQSTFVGLYPLQKQYAARPNFSLKPSFQNETCRNEVSKDIYPGC